MSMTPIATNDRSDVPPTAKPLAVSVEYRPLHKYLDGRFADNVVLKFAEIEDILGFALPDLARRGPEWWADTDNPVAPQSRAWRRASRTATVNFASQTVMFERESH